jgi:CRISPR-associated protein Csd1
VTILQSLAQFYDRLEKRGQVSKRGYMPAPISFVIPINPDGSVQSAIDIRDAEGKRARPVERSVPKLRDHNNSGKDPFLFWDNTGYALGISAKQMKRGSAEDQFSSFRTRNLAALKDATSEELRAFRKFLGTWDPTNLGALGIREDGFDANVVFRYAETGMLIHGTEESQAIWARQISSESASGLCLVAGRELPIERLHPKFPALEAGGSRAPIVSFNEKAFESYGKEQGANAPVSEEAAFRYGAALNWLLDRSNARSFRLGETTVVFWADDKEGEVGEASASAAEEAFWAEFGATPERDVDAEEADTVRRDLTNVQALRAAPDIKALKAETRLHILGLSPNSGRIAVRFWLVDTYGHLEENLKRYKNDIAIVPPGPFPHQKAYALLYETAVQRKRENIPPRLGGELAHAILTGARYPRTLLTSVIGRMRADKGVNAARAGICKAVINRDNEREVIPLALNPESDDQAYNLGRLFAAYEYAERQVAERNATIRDKYIGAASATPRRVFPILMRGYEHNASALARGEGNQRGSGIKAAKAITQILERFGGDMPFPTTLTLEEQGRFFVGYYHQNAALYTRSDRGADTKKLEGAST